MKKRVSWGLVFLCLAVMFTLALVSGAIAQPGELVKGVLQPLADGFPKRNLNIIVVDDPGSRDDLYAKSLQAALKGISPVNITVSCEPAAGGGTWITIHDVLKRDGGPEGYYPIVINPYGVVTDLHSEPYTRDINAKFEDLNMIIYTEVMPYIIIQRKNAPWGPTFAGMVKYGKENPGKLKYISKEVGSGYDIAWEWIALTLGLKTQKMPQGTMQEVASTVGAGVGDFAINDTITAVTNAQAGRLDATMIFGSTVPDIFKKLNPNIISAKEFGLSTELAGADLGLGVPSQVPQAHVDWMYKLFRIAATSPLHQKRATLIPGLVFNIQDGAYINAQNKRLLASSEPVIRAIGLHIDDIQKKK